MAIVDLAITNTRRTQSIKTEPGVIVQETSLPVGLTWFYSVTTIVAKIATNETHIRITTNFPNQYTYILKEMGIAIRLAEGTTNNFGQFGTIVALNCSPIVTLPDQYLALENKGLQFEFEAADVVNPLRSYDLTQKFHQVIQPPDGQTASWIVELADEDAGATNAGTMFFSACFWRYGIEQALNYPLNHPSPVLVY